MEPVIKQLIKLEQYYETDIVVLSIAAQKAQLWMRYGINEITDELLKPGPNHYGISRTGRYGSHGQA